MRDYLSNMKHQSATAEKPVLAVCWEPGLRAYRYDTESRWNGRWVCRLYAGAGHMQNHAAGAARTTDLSWSVCWPKEGNPSWPEGVTDWASYVAWCRRHDLPANTTQSVLPKDAPLEDVAKLAYDCMKRYLAPGSAGHPDAIQPPLIVIVESSVLRGCHLVVDMEDSAADEGPLVGDWVPRSAMEYLA